MYNPIYTISIAKTQRTNIWYSTKRHQKFEATLDIVENTVMFKVDPMRYVFPEDCVIVSQTIMSRFK